METRVWLALATGHVPNAERRVPEAMSKARRQPAGRRTTTGGQGEPHRSRRQCSGRRRDIRETGYRDHGAMVGCFGPGEQCGVMREIQHPDIVSVVELGFNLVVQQSDPHAQTDVVFAHWSVRREA